MSEIIARLLPQARATVAMHVHLQKRRGAPHEAALRVPAIPRIGGSPDCTLSAAAAGLVLVVWCVPALAQGTSPLQATSSHVSCHAGEARPDDSRPAEGESSLSQPCVATPTSVPFVPVLLPASVVLPGSPAFTRDSSNPPEAERSEEAQRSEDERPLSYGVEIEFRSGHADRGFVISDSPVVQPVMWLSSSAATFSAWSNLTLAETTDRSRPQILELELTRTHEWGNLTIGPAIRTFFYRDPPSTYSSRSIESWLYLSYHAGPLRLFTNHSVDVLAYKGAYFGEAGIALEGRMSRSVEVGGSVGGGWASSMFNDAYAGIGRSAFNRISVEGWLTAHLKPGLYIGPRFEFSVTMDRAMRAELAKPIWLFVGLAAGVEFQMRSSTNRSPGSSPPRNGSR
jgi:hypothetical protein